MASSESPAISRLGVVGRWVLALLFIAAGLNHFRDPGIYAPVLPRGLTRPDFWIAFTGVAEVVGGVGLLVPRLRTTAAWCLIVMLIGFLWAHVDMLLRPVVIEGRRVPRWLLWARLPLQFVLIAWVYWAGGLRYSSAMKADSQ